MIAFADLLERLVFTPGRLGKIALLRRYFATQPDPDRGYGQETEVAVFVALAARARTARCSVRAGHRDGEMRAVQRQHREHHQREHAGRSERDAPGKREREGRHHGWRECPAEASGDAVHAERMAQAR